MTTHHPNAPIPHVQRGFTLVELMIALVLGLLLMTGVAQVFSSSSKTYRVHEGLSRIQENGRTAIEFLKRDIRMADFWGCANRVNKVTNNLDPLNGGTSWQYNFANGGLIGTDGGGNNPDSIILRGAFGTGLTIMPPYGPQASSNLKVATNNIIDQGDILIVSDCESADVFQMTNPNNTTNPPVVHNTGSGDTPGNYNATNPGCPGANAHCLSKVYEGDAQIFRAQTIAYSIATGSSGRPALFRDDGINPAMELVDGVANLQFLYGEDNDAPGAAGFGTADYYVRADQVTDMENVVSVKISLLLESYEDNLTVSPMTVAYNGGTITAADQRLYKVFNSTVAVRNRVQ